MQVVRLSAEYGPAKTVYNLEPLRLTPQILDLATGCRPRRVAGQPLLVCLQ